MKKSQVESALKIAKLRKLKNTALQLERILEDYESAKYSVYLFDEGWKLVRVMNQEQVDDLIFKMRETLEIDDIMIIKKLKDRDEPYYSTRNDKVLKKKIKELGL